MMHQVSERNGKVKVIPVSELTRDCWLIQFWGLPACRTCDSYQTKECGGENIRKNLLGGNGHGRVDPMNGLPDAQPGTLTLYVPG